MNQSELWSSIRYDLMCACQTLPKDAGIHEAIGQCREYLEHNELELACDALERYGNENPVPSDFWIALRNAAIKMGLQRNASRFAARISI